MRRRNQRRAVAASIALLAVGFRLDVVASQAGTEAAGRNVITFTAQVDDNWELFVSNQDGSDVRRLTHTPYDEREPAVSPDRRVIAVSNSAGGIELVSVAAGGEAEVLALPKGWYRHPAWSSDGSRLYFVRLESREGLERSSMWSYEVTSKRASVLFEQTGIQSHPAAAGKDRVIYSLAITGPRSQVVRQVWWARADGSEAEQVFMDNADDAQVDVSPDGHKLAFASAKRGGAYQVWIAEADGSKPRRLTTGASIESDPSWSPDGRFVLLVGLRESATRLFVRAIDGGEASEIPLEGLDGVSVRDPDWR